MTRTYLLTLLAAALPSFARADIIHFYYVGVDNQPTITSGTYSGLSNPNFGHLTFLYGHQTTPPDGAESGSHFHAKGSFSYTGPNLGAATAVNPYNGTAGVSNTSRDDNIWQLSPGSGPLSGLYVAGQNSADISGNYSRIRGVGALATAAAGTADYFQYHSASDRWNQSLNAAHLQINLVSISPGFKIVTASGAVLLQNAGDHVDLGPGGALDFTPVLATTSAGLTGSAVFTLTDLNGVFGSSGQFVYNVSSTPEPSSLILLGSLAIGAAGWRRLKARRGIVSAKKQSPQV